MNKTHRRIISGAIVAVCAVAGISAASAVSRKASPDAVPAATTLYSDETPVIILDAGHGGFDGGCVSVDGTPEKGINLDILLRLRDILEINGYEVIVTRDEDVSIHDSGIEGMAAQKGSDMDNRLEIFNSSDNAVCISIHQNRFTDPQYSGAQMFFHKENSDGGRLAECLRARIVGMIQPGNEREVKAMDDELYLLCNCKNPAVMAECGFISNPKEAAKLESAEYRREMAFALMSGLNDFHIDSGRLELYRSE